MKHKIKDVLERKGMTQKELAEKIGMTEVGVSKMIANGTTTKATIKKVADVLGVSEADVMYIEHVPSAKYEGELNIGDKSLHCAVLDNGVRILSATAVFDAFNRPRKGKSNEGYRADQMPAFINANNLQPFIDEQFIEWTELIDYIDTRGIRRQGYNARVLRGLCKVYIDAFNAGVLQKSQLRFVPISQSILYTLSDIGIIALVDEATGFDKAKERAKNQLQQFLNQFLREEAAKWVKTFNDQFFEDIYRMRKWNWSDTSKRPGVVGTWIKEIVYDRIGPITPELEKRNPKNEHGNRNHKHHQFLSNDVGLPKLKQHLEAVHALAVSSDYDWNRFIRNLDKVYPRTGQELFIDFPADED